MLAGGTDEGYRRVLASGGSPVRRVEVWRSGVRIDPFGDAGLDVISGSVSCSLANRVTRSVTMRVDHSLFPWDVSDILDPFGSEVRIWAGWGGGAMPAWSWPVFRGPVTSCSLASNSDGVDVRCSDRAEMIIADEFLVPRDSGSGVLTTTRIKDLISDTLPDATFGIFDEMYTTVPKVTWDNDRAKALDDLAAAAGCHWYSLADGSFTHRRIPWSLEVPSPPVATFTLGVDMSQMSVSVSRENVRNMVSVLGEAANGQPPVQASVSNEDPTSRSYAFGPLGRRVSVVREDAIGSQPQAAALAAQRLRRLKATMVNCQATVTMDPSLELGDTCVLVGFGRSHTQILSDFSLPLTGAADMTTTWRNVGEGDTDGG